MRISDWSSDVCSSDLASHNRYTASGASGSPGSLVNLSHFNMHLYCIYQFAGIHAARIHDWRRLVSMSGDILDKLDDAGLKNVVNNFYGRVRDDTELGPVFDDAISDWPPHIGKMVDFWSSVMLTTGRYKGKIGRRAG